jgi:hypothetical protein
VAEIAELIKSIAGKVGQIHYVDHNFGNIKVFWGIPPVQLTGLSYVLAYHTAPKNKLIKSLNSSGVFVSNQNTSGIVELGILSTSVSCAAIQIIDLTGLAAPFALTDSDAILSTAAGAAAKLTVTPEWRRSKNPNVTVYTFEVDKLIISHGMKKTVD